MNTNYYRHVIEALGMRSKTATVVNKLNKVAAHSTDTKLQGLAAKVIHELQFKSTSPKIVPVKEMTGMPSAKELMAYCQGKAQQAD